MLKTIMGWVLFFGGLGIEFAVDYTLRMRDGDITTVGIDELLGFSIQILLGIGAAILLYQGTASFKKIWQRLSAVSIQVILAWVIYVIVSLWYVTGTGIDSL